MVEEAVMTDNGFFLDQVSLGVDTQAEIMPERVVTDQCADLFQLLGRMPMVSYKGVPVVE